MRYISFGEIHALVLKLSLCIKWLIKRTNITWANLSLVFICQENPRWSGILLFADRPRYIGKSPQFCPWFSRWIWPEMESVPKIETWVIGGQFRGLVMSEIHRRRPPWHKFEFSSIGNDRRPSQKSGTRRENRNVPDSPDLSPSDPRRSGISTISSFH